MKNSKIFFLILFIWIIISTPAFLYGQRIQVPLIDLVKYIPATCPDISCQKQVKLFWSTFQFLDQKLSDENKMKGKASFDFTGDDSGAANKFVFGSGISLSKGTFPSQFKFSYNSDVNFTNNSLKENLTNVYASFDYHPGFGDPLTHELFGFANRFSDNYLGVDQRYEIGGGLILESWSKNHLTTIGDKENSKINSFLFNDTTYDKKFLLGCALKTTPFDTLISDFMSIAGSQQRFNKINVKQNAILRMGILLGMFFELEKITAKDSINSVIGKESFMYEFQPSHKIRLEIRPFINFKIGPSVDFYFKPYFKFPFPGRGKDLVQRGNQKSERYDIRIDTEAALTVSLTPPEVDHNKVSISMQYNHYFDNAPNRVFTDKKDSNDMFVLYAAHKYHQMIKMKLGLDF